MTVVAKRQGPSALLLVESQRYVEAAQHHWFIILSIGPFFGWLLSFPLQGPLLGSLVESRAADPFEPTVAFLIGHIAGLVGAGILGYFRRWSLPLFALAAIPCAALSLLAAVFPPSGWDVLFGLMGLFAGFGIIGWGSAFAASVLPKQRARAFVVGAVLSNVVLYITALLAGRVGLNWLLWPISLLPLSLPAVLFWAYRRIDLSVPATRPKLRGKGSGNIWPFLPFIFAVYVLGGLMYYVIGNLSTPPGELLGKVALVPYVLLLVAAGTLAERSGRYAIAVVGALAVGVGFMTTGILSGPAQFLAIQVFLVGGYAFLDTFTLVVATDLSTPRQAPIYYAAILGVDVSAILVGILLAETVGRATAGSEALTVSVAGILSILSLGFVVILGQRTLRSSPAMNPRFALDSSSALSAKCRLTPRETEIARLLLSGVSMQEIRDQLVIAPDTLKTHLRNMYRKAGVRNRIEFTVLVSRSPVGEQADISRAK
ncbi:MAG: hypothetical protein HY681_02075 [Chloroflexi bacterium]|nr:hypothetical protein [Chloroflexota bacterium]